MGGTMKGKLILFSVILLFLLIIIGTAVIRINDWFETHRFQFNQPIIVTLQKPVEIKERKVEAQEIVRIIETIPAPEDLETEPEKLIYKYFGIEHYRMAIAVSRCEGLNHPA